MPGSPGLGSSLPHAMRAKAVAAASNPAAIRLLRPIIGLTLIPVESLIPVVDADPALNVGMLTGGPFGQRVDVCLERRRSSRAEGTPEGPSANFGFMRCPRQRRSRRAQS